MTLNERSRIPGGSCRIVYRQDITYHYRNGMYGYNYMHKPYLPLTKWEDGLVQNATCTAP
jgi:hypothetical protein